MLGNKNELFEYSKIKIDLELFDKYKYIKKYENIKAVLRGNFSEIKINQTSLAITKVNISIKESLVNTSENLKANR